MSKICGYICGYICAAIKIAKQLIWQNHVKNLFHKLINNFSRKNVIDTELETIRVIKYDIDELKLIVYKMYNKLYNKGETNEDPSDADAEGDIYSRELSKKISDEFMNNVEMYTEIITKNNNETLANKIIANKIYNEYIENIELYEDVLNEDTLQTGLRYRKASPKIKLTKGRPF